MTPVFLKANDLQPVAASATVADWTLADRFLGRPRSRTVGRKRPTRCTELGRWIATDTFLYRRGDDFSMTLTHWGGNLGDFLTYHRDGSVTLDLHGLSEPSADIPGSYGRRVCFRRRVCQFTPLWVGIRRQYQDLTQTRVIGDKRQWVVLTADARLAPFHDGMRVHPLGIKDWVAGVCSLEWNPDDYADRGVIADWLSERGHELLEREVRKIPNGEAVYDTTGLLPGG